MSEKDKKNESGCCSSKASDASEKTALDPVCGMSVDPEKTPHSYEHEGETHYFCSAGCQKKFENDPATYSIPLEERQKREAEEAPGAIYTCPMYPEVITPKGKRMTVD